MIYALQMTELSKKTSLILTQSGLYTSKQIAAYIRVSPRTISNMVRERRIPVIKFGGSVRFDPIKVMQALEKYEIDAI